MIYRSTRDNRISVESARAIAQGLSDEGGLFVPDTLPKLSEADFKALCGKSYSDRAFEIFKLFLTDFTDEEIRACVDGAYGSGFDTENVSELSHLLSGTYILELWHGPTCAFKDMALQILPHLLTVSAKKVIDGKEIAILVATSGDTGKAALEGFKDVPGTSITVFYPEDGVSDMQKRQMTTQEGGNVHVCAVKGNFDDCQNGVKAIFTDEALKAELEKKKIVFSSANSINWGRLCPQIVYYISAYVSLMESGELEYGEKVNIVVPTGNFGNILAAYYAKQMGLPVKKLICASNANNVLTDFIRTGTYDRNRDFHTTISPSMDILISSNLERLLYHLTDGDDEQIAEWFGALSRLGKYTVSSPVLKKLKNDFWAGCCDDTQTKAAIREVFDTYSYLMDTHTAVAYRVYRDYREETGDTAKAIIASTANPYKFGAAVSEAVGLSTEGLDEFTVIENLEKHTATTMPAPLAATKGKPIRFTDSVEKQEMPAAVLRYLGQR